MNSPIARKRAPIIPSGVQLKQADRAAGAADADELVGGRLVEGREHHPDRGDDDVEAVVLEGKVVGVGLGPLQLDSLGLGAGAAGVEELGGEVAGDDVGAGLRRRDRGVAGAGGDVEDAHARADPGGLDQARPEGQEEGLDHRGVIAGGPHLPVFLSQLWAGTWGIGAGGHC